MLIVLQTQSAWSVSAMSFSKLLSHENQIENSLQWLKINSGKGKFQEAYVST